VSGEALLRRLAARPRALVAASASTAAGGLIGFGAFVYLTYRLPTFMDAARFQIALERGLFLGLPVGAGLLLARLIVQRWLHLALPLRLAAATVLGGLVINTTLFLYSFLFLDLAPEGWLITLGSGIMALGVALGAALRRRPAAMMVGFVSAGLALALTWALHLATGMHPLLFYEYAWPASQVALAVVLTALPLAIGANLFDLSPGKDADESR
jgi:hypothetical protein